MYNGKELKTNSTAQENKSNPYSKDVIYDPKGQWAHPGEVTRIPGGNITMKGVPYPVLGIDDQGNEQLMLPGGRYDFPGAMNVTEYPQIAQKGRQVETKSRSLLDVASQFVPVYDTYLDWKSMLHGLSTGDKNEMYTGILGLAAPFSGKALGNVVDYTTEKTLGKNTADYNQQKRESIINMSQHDREKLFSKYGHGGYDAWAKDGYPQLQEGGNAGMIGMMKARMAYANEFGNPAAKRMVSPNPKTGMTPEGIGTHYMGAADNYAVPKLQDRGNSLLDYMEHPAPGPEDIRFESNEDADYFAEHYKDIAPMMYNKKQMGGDISIAPINHQFTKHKTKWLDKQQSGGEPDVEKARAFLDEGSIYGHPLSAAQIEHFSKIAGPMDEDGEFEDVEEDLTDLIEEFRRGGVSPLQRTRSKRSKTSKNIKTSVNKLMMRNQDLFGPSGRNVYDPNAKGESHKWLDKYHGL